MATTEAPAPARESGQRRRSRPPTEYWDFRTASWRTAATVVPTPRRGE